MKIKDQVQTVFLICCVISIILFGFIYSLMVKDINNLAETVKESFSLTASFFGGIATLAAAYIATILFNDWKDQEKYKLHLKFIESISSDCIVLISELRKIAYPTAKIKAAIKIYKADPENTEVTIKDIRELIDENYEVNLFMVKYFKAAINSLDRYSKFSNDFSLSTYKSIIILYYSEYTQYKSAHINDPDKSMDEIQTDAIKLLDLIKKFSSKIEQELIPILDEMNSPDYWKKISNKSPN